MSGKSGKENGLTGRTGLRGHQQHRKRHRRRHDGPDDDALEGSLWAADREEREEPDPATEAPISVAT